MLEATHGIPLWKNDDSYEYLDMPRVQHDEVVASYEEEQAKSNVFSKWASSHPFPMWEHVKGLLQWLEREGRGRKGAAKDLEDTYIRSKC